MATSETKRTVIIRVDAGQSQQALKVIADQMGGLNKNTKDLADAFGLLKAGAISLIGGLGIRQLVDFNDQIQELNNHLLSLTGNQGKATILLNQLAQASRDTNTPLQVTADTFTKVSIALKEANIDSSTMIDFTKTLINTFRLSGSSAEDASRAVTSLSYALQQGGLRGRELRTVLRENKELGALLRKEFGGNIMQAANNGFITTAKVFEIIGKNADVVNDRAKHLEATFGQSMTKALDAFKLKIFEVNEALGGSKGFSGVMQTVVENMGLVVTGMTILAAGAIPALVTQVYRLGAALVALSAPGIAAALGSGGFLVAGLTAVVGLFADNPGNPADVILQLKAGFYELKAAILDVFGTIFTAISKIKILPAQVSEDMAALGAATTEAGQAAKDYSVHLQAQRVELEVNQILLEKTAKSASNWGDAVKKASVFQMDETPAMMLARLNNEFLHGSITVEQYNQMIQQVDLSKARKEFETGHIDLEKLNDSLDKFSTYNLNVQLRDGIITLREYDTGIRAISAGRLKSLFDAGIISLEEYNRKIASVSDKFSPGGAFRTGLQDYLDSIGTTTQQVADAITHAFKNVEDSFVSFVKTGKFNFDKFTQDILDDLLRIIIRASIIAPLAGSLLGAIGGGRGGGPLVGHPGTSNTSYSNTAAHGAYFAGGASHFASGGVVSTPTLFGFNNNRTGLMGEAGPEAILPLKRGSGGDLGVKATVTPVTINIINQNNSDISQSETTGPGGEKQIELLITGKVREGISSGRFDKAFKQSFGVSRKGT